jgi:hypothetical protein
MATIIDCPQCSRKLRLADGLGPNVRCPTCGHTFAPERPAAPSVNGAALCPFCREEIAPNATRCLRCDENLLDERPPWERDAYLRRDSVPHRGGAVLALGITGLVASVIPYFCFVGIPLSATAWIMGQYDLRRIRNNEMDPRGSGSTTAGMVCGIIGTIFGVLWLLFAAGMFFLFASL